MPRSATFNRELIKKQPIAELMPALFRQHPTLPEHAAAHRILVQESHAWEKHCQSQGRYGAVKQVNHTLYYYEFHPISNGLAALALERMRQQGEAIGIQWNMDYYTLPQDFDTLTSRDTSLPELKYNHSRIFMSMPWSYFNPTIRVRICSHCAIIINFWSTAISI